MLRLILTVSRGWIGWFPVAVKVCLSSPVNSHWFGLPRIWLHGLYRFLPGCHSWKSPCQISGRTIRPIVKSHKTLESAEKHEVYFIILILVVNLLDVLGFKVNPVFVENRNKKSDCLSHVPDIWTRRNEIRSKKPVIAHSGIQEYWLPQSLPPFRKWRKMTLISENKGHKSQLMWYKCSIILEDDLLKCTLFPKKFFQVYQLCQLQRQSL